MSRSLCPKCYSSDGLAVYEDGSYCFACNNTINKYNFGYASTKKENKLGVPINLGHKIPEEYVAWMVKYNIKPSEAYWDGSRKRLCFPSMDGKAAWLRSLTEAPKWLLAGSKYSLFMYGVKTKNLCLVEDVVSAIKVSSIMQTIALGGTNLKDSILSTIVRGYYKKIYIFLDGDEAGKEGAQKIRNELKLIKNCIILRGNKDPKDYSLNDLKEMFKEVKL